MHRVLFGVIPVDAEFVKKVQELSAKTSSVDEATISITESMVAELGLGPMLSNPESPAIQAFYSALQRKTAWRWKYDRPNVPEIQDSDLLEAAQMANTARRIFEKGVREDKIEYLCISSIVFSFMDFELSDYIDVGSLRDSFRGVVGKSLAEILSHAKMDVRIAPNAPYAERKFYSTYVEGTSEKNFQKVYEFITAIQMGTGLICSPPLKGVLRLLCFLDIGSLAEISSGVDPVSFSIFVEALSPSDVFRLVEVLPARETFQALWILRRILLGGDDFSSQDALPHVVELLRKLYEIDTELTSFLFSQFRNSSVFYKAFGVFLATGPDHIDRFLDSLSFEVNNTLNVERYRELYEHFGNSLKDEARLIKCEEAIYEKYLTFKRGLIEDGGYLSGVFIGDMTHFLLSYFCRATKTKEAFIRMFRESFTQLKQSTVRWHSKEGARRTACLFGMTDLYLLSFCPQSNGYSVSRDEVLDIIEFLNDKRYWVWLFGDREEILTIPDLHHRILENLSLSA